MTKDFLLQQPMSDLREEELLQICKKLALEVWENGKTAEEFLFISFNLTRAITTSVAEVYRDIGMPAHENIKGLALMLASFKNGLEEEVLALYEE